ncbi:MAG: hypothetical protein RL033_7204, partial [Pseudomonadota bacterium]
MQRAPGSERGRSSSRAGSKAAESSQAKSSQAESSLGGVFLRGLTASGLLLLVACGGADVAQTEGSASLEAVLSIDRIEDAAHGEASAASAMAQFV